MALGLITRSLFLQIPNLDLNVLGLGHNIKASSSSSSRTNVYNQVGRYVFLPQELTPSLTNKCYEVLVKIRVISTKVP